VTELSGYAFSPLREGDFTRSRGVGNGLPPILLVAAEDASLGSFRRLEHEYAIKSELDAAWAALPVALCRYNDRMTLVLEDPGGEPLDLLLGQPLQVAEFLRIAVPLSAVLARVHERGLIHKDLKPANVLVDVANGGVWLTGFGVASRLPREHQNPEPPAMIAGTLAYMAPEQTGRMNRSIDSRSDLYAFGVTLYEMLTGALPFTASDPMEWIHCHIARPPVPPNELMIAIPAQLSAIVMKLLAKTAEQRYQTATGLAADLRRCLSTWQSSQQIDVFPLGMQDASDQLIIPERLYGREHEIQALLGAFDRVVSHGTTELVLVSGYSGVGKSSVVNELHKVLVPPRGLFAAGKFDQYKRDIPYAPLAQAFQSLVRSILGLGEEELARWRDSLNEALGSNGALIINLVPELELIIGEQPPVADLSPLETQRRFQMVFRQFVAVFARPEHPLALFLDDLQWLDAATLDVLEHLVTHSEVRHLLVVGAYRDNEIGPSDSLAWTLNHIRKSKAEVCEIVLAPLGLRDVERLIVDILHCDREHALPLSQLVQEKTGGNPFFTIQFILELAEEGLIWFDRSAAAWNWDLARIRAKSFTDNVVDLMVTKLSRLSDVTLETLRLLACLGNTAEVAMLSLIQSEAESATDSRLWEAVRAGIVYRQDDSYKFLHDRVQEAAYALIPEGERAAVHLRIGRRLAAAMSDDKLSEQIFDVVNQFNRAAGLISDPDEVERSANLNLRAGRKARESTAYASARRYFGAGMALLGPTSWTTRYDLAFSLTLERAECTFLSSEFDEAEELTRELLARALSSVNQAAVYRLKIEIHSVKSENSQAVDSALECLRLFGIDMPAHPSRDEVHAEYGRMWRDLGDRPIESLIDLPRAAAPEAHAAMRILAALIAPAFYTDPNLFDLQVCQMVNLSLRHGTTDASTHGYGWFGWILCYAFQRYDEGYRFGKLALDLVEKRGFVVDTAKVHYAMGVIVSWMRPLATSVDNFRTAFRTGIETGDLFFATSSASQIIIRLLLTGAALDEVWRESEKFMDFANKLGFRDGAALIVSQQRFVAAMRGKTASLSTFSDAVFDEPTFEADLTSDRMPTMVCWYWILKIEARYLSGDYQQALEAIDKAERLMWATPGEIQLLDYHLFSALTLGSIYARVPSEQRGDLLERLRPHHEQLREWAAICPENFGSAAALVDAEVARVEGRELDAMRLYEKAIREARAQGFIQNEGIANELAARFYDALGCETIAQTYVRNARYCYLHWGAEGKVHQLEQLHPHLTAAPLTNTADASVEQLEVGTVVKASQALSGEIVLDKLVEVLMRIAIEHAGANRGLLVLPESGVYRIEAEAIADSDRIEVRIHGTVATASDLPVSIIQYVVRTGESVILDDALTLNPFSADSYIRDKRSRSVFCLPLERQTNLIGALYLENNLASHVFTPARASLLKMLASQAAISLENARLYSELINMNRDLQNAEAALRRSEASLNEAQQISHTGSWRWNVATGQVFSSEELLRIFAFDPTTAKPSYATFMERIAAEDRPSFEQALDRAVRERSRFQCDYRINLPDGSVKYLQIAGQPDILEDGDPEFVGTVMDITERRRAEDALRNAQAELARIARVTTMGELLASIVHEISQPLVGIVNSGNACLRWLDREEPDIEAARQSVSHIVRDGTRAGDVIRGLRALAKKSGLKLAKLDINAAIQEVLALTRSEFQWHGIVLHTALSAADRPVLGDRVQLQQVMLNLIMNGIEAMSAVTDRPKVLTITSEPVEPSGVQVAVEDTGTGLDPTTADRIFDPFFTTKPAGMGMGLSISRSIVHAHEGRFWASPRTPCGTVLKFTVPGYSKVESNGAPE
jgi:predicted ATPase/signal transduction histidine kinase/GAF domain-containing protein